MTIGGWTGTSWVAAVVVSGFETAPTDGRTAVATGAGLVPVAMLPATGRPASGCGAAAAAVTRETACAALVGATPATETADVAPAGGVFSGSAGDTGDMAVTECTDAAASPCGGVAITVEPAAGLRAVAAVPEDAGWRAAITSGVEVEAAATGEAGLKEAAVAATDDAGLAEIGAAEPATGLAAGEIGTVGRTGVETAVTLATG